MSLVLALHFSWEYFNSSPRQSTLELQLCTQSVVLKVLLIVLGLFSALNALMELCGWNTGILLIWMGLTVNTTQSS